MTTKIYILHKLPTPYNDDLFRALDAADDLDLQVFHLWRGSDRRPWKEQLGLGYPNRYLDVHLGVDLASLLAAWNDPDSLWVVGDWGHAPTLAMIATRLARRAPVALWVDTPQEHLPRPFYKRVPRARFLRWLLRRVDAILASGKPARRVLLEMGAPETSIVDFQFLVDLDRPARARANPRAVERASQLRHRVGCDERGTVFAMCGTIDFAKKAQDVGLRAFADARRRSTRPVGLLVAGAGDQLPALAALADDLGISESVAFLGWQEPDDMDSVYLATDALFHPANYDPFPLVVIESMSFGLAVVGSSTCGSIEERVVDGESGHVFQPGDQAAMVEGLLRLGEDPEHLTRAKRAARATAETWPMARGVEIVRSLARELLTART